MPLKIKIKANERIIINGAVLTALGDTAFLVNNHANMLLERQIMRPEQADSPARRIYFNVQATYMASPEEHPGCLARAEEYIDQFTRATYSEEIRSLLDEIKSFNREGKFYDALKLINRKLIPYEDGVLGRTKPAEPEWHAEAVAHR